MEKLLVIPHERELNEIFQEYCQHLPQGDQELLKKYFHPVLDAYHQIKGTLFGISESDDEILDKIVREKCEEVPEKRIKKIYSILDKAFKFIEPKLFERVKGTKPGSLRTDILTPGSKCHYTKEYLLQKISKIPHNLSLIRNTVYDPLSASKVIYPINLELLERMNIIQLVPGKIYTNKVIYATLIDTGFKMIAYHSIIEDETGQCAEFCIYNISPHLEQYLIPGVKIAIASPYYKSVGGDECNHIRVDTPEEVIILPDCVSKHNSNISNEEYKLRGNDFFSSGKYFEAIVCYTKAINGNPSNPIYRSNRALCYLKTEYFEEALLDAEKAIELDLNSSKFKHRLAMSWSGLGNHEKSVQILEEIRNDIDIESLLKIERTLLANSNGKIDMEDFARSARAGENLKIGDYIGPITIEISPKYGHGVFATRNIKKGEVILVIKAVAFVAKTTTEELTALRETTPYGISCKMNNALLIQRLIGYIVKSKLTAFRVFNLFNKNFHQEPIPIEFYKSQGFELIRDKQKPPYQMDQIRKIVLDSTHTYNQDEVLEDESIISSGIWPIFSYLNHACIGNVWQQYFHDYLIIKACTQILKGAELTKSFFDTCTFLSLEDRRDLLANNWNYECNCDLCTFESYPENKHALARAIYLCNRVKKQFPSIISFYVLQYNDYKLLNQALSLADELELGPNRSNAAIWQVINTLTELRVSPKDEKKFFAIINRAEKFLCERNLKHQWFFWKNCIMFAAQANDDYGAFKLYAKQRFDEVDSYVNDIP